MANDSVTATFARLVEFMANKFMRGEVTLAELFALEQREVEVIFMMGHYLFNFGKYQAALNIFSVLTMYKPMVSKYWRAAGAANQALKQYKEAVLAYDMALTTNFEDVISYTYRGESKISMGKVEEGIEDLRRAVQVGAAKPFYTKWVNRAKTLLSVRGVTP
jgi:type III secretion system low calcium response chaperone LcrH/SycD